MSTESRDAALADVRDHASKDFNWYAERALHTVCQQQDTFTSEDVWRTLKLFNRWVTTTEPRAMGAVMKRAIGTWAEPMNELVASDNRTSHNRPLRKWRSLVR